MNQVTRNVLVQCCLLLVSCGKESRHDFVLSVRDESGIPVEGASVVGQIIRPDREDPAEWIVRGVTDSAGSVSFQGPTLTDPSFYVEKKGYYRSATYVPLGKGEGEASGGALLRHKGEIILREIKNPVPMYARRALIYLPTFGVKYGYDFEAGDLVKPHGNGTKGMIFFELHQEEGNTGAFMLTCSITFPNKFDGWNKEERWDVGMSDFKWPYFAGDDFQTSALVFKFGLSEGQHRSYSEEGLKLPYVFRLNSVADPKSGSVSSNFCRIEPTTELGGGKDQNAAGALRITYYYNPKRDDKHSEFDQKRNLAAEGRSGSITDLEP